jgi:hypothetical protein
VRFLLTAFLHSRPSILCILLPIPDRVLQPIGSLHNHGDKGGESKVQKGWIVSFETYFNMTDGYDVGCFRVRLRQGQK